MKVVIHYNDGRLRVVKNVDAVMDAISSEHQEIWKIFTKDKKVVRVNKNEATIRYS